MNPSLVFLSAALFLWGFGESMFIIFQPFYLTQLGANPVMIGYILGAAGIATTIGHIPAGYLADRVGRKEMLITAWLTGVAATWVMALANGLPGFVVGLVLYSLTIFVSAPLNSYLAAARGSWTVGRVFSLSSAFYNLGVVVGPLIGGWVGQNYGLKRVYLVSGVIFILSTCMVLMIRRQPREHPEPGISPRGLLTNWRFIGFLGLGFYAFLAMYLPQPFTVKFLQDVRSFSLEQVGLMGTIGGVGNTLLMYLIGGLDTRAGFILGQVGVALFNLLLWRMSGSIWIGLGFFALGGYRVARALYMALIRPLVPQSQMGLAFGISETVIGTINILAPIAAGLLYDRDKILTYPIALAAITAGIALSLFFSPRSPKETSTAAANVLEGGT